MSRYNPGSIQDSDTFAKIYPQYVTLNEDNPYWTIPTDAGKKRQFFDAVEDWDGMGEPDSDEISLLNHIEDNFQLYDPIIYFNKRAQLELDQEKVTWLNAGENSKGVAISVPMQVPFPSRVAVPLSLIKGSQHNLQVGLAQYECDKQGIKFSSNKISPTMKGQL